MTKSKQLPKIDYDSIPYGTKPDAVLAKAFGCSPSTVAFQRNKRGIKPFGNAYTQRPRKHGRLSKAEREAMAKKRKVKCSVDGCRGKVCVDVCLKNPEGLCREHLFPDRVPAEVPTWTESPLGWCR